MSDSTQEKTDRRVTDQQIAEDAGYKVLNAARLLTILAESDEGRDRISGDLVELLACIIQDGAKQIVQISADTANWTARARRK
jgi:hypothetical protein